MEVQLNRDQEAFIQRSIESGRFSSAADAMREAIDLLARREDGLTGVRNFVNQGLTDLASGEYEDFSDENLHELFEGVTHRGRTKLAADRQ